MWLDSLSVRARLRHPESRDDFVHKLSIALKELKETRGWLKFIPLAGLLPEHKVKALLVECEELVKILGKSVSTAKGKGASSAARNVKCPVTNV